MAKAKGSIEDFLHDIPDDYHALVLQLHEWFVEQGCALKLQEAKSGHVVSYLHPADKKAVANFVSRKAGPMARIYADSVVVDDAALRDLSDELAARVDKAPVCRRLLDPNKCNSRCPMGFDFVLRGAHYQKCRFSCFLFPITEENYPTIHALAAQEVRARAE